MGNRANAKKPTHLSSDTRPETTNRSGLQIVPAPSSRLLERALEIDVARGAGVVAMIFYHFLYDLKVFSRFKPELPDSFWPYGSHLIGLVFFTVFGMSAWLTHQQDPAKRKARFKRRTIALFGVAAGITALTSILNPKNPIYFGVIHCFAVCTVLIVPFLRMKPLFNLSLGTMVAFLALPLQREQVPYSYLLWLGLRPEAGTGGDWYPLVPWFGVSLIGVALGRWLYENRTEPYLTKRTHTRTMSAFIYLGRHSLPIYLLHQPILIALILAANRL